MARVREKFDNMLPAKKRAAFSAVYYNVTFPIKWIDHLPVPPNIDSD